MKAEAIPRYTPTTFDGPFYLILGVVTRVIPRMLILFDENPCVNYSNGEQQPCDDLTPQTIALALISFDI
jgi:hypothetical protein